MATPACALFALLPLTLILSPGAAFSLAPGTAMAPFAPQVARRPPRNPYCLQVRGTLLGLAEAYQGGKGVLRLLHHAGHGGVLAVASAEVIAHGQVCVVSRGRRARPGEVLAPRWGCGCRNRCLISSLLPSSLELSDTQV